MSRADHRHAAREQRVCAVTGRGGSFHPHHVVREQDVRGGDPHDRRNALRVKPDVHFDHHQAFIRIPLRSLTDANIEYAFELLGPKAQDYLARHYAGQDPRLDRVLKAREGLQPGASE